MTPAKCIRGSLLVGAVAMLVGCVGLHPVDPSSAPLELTIAHMNDHHSNLEALQDLEIQIDGVPTRVDVGGFARAVTVFKTYESDANLLKIHAGDAITGTPFYTVSKGKADAALMNEVCFDAFTPGNHEFDGGDAGLQTFLAFLTKDATCKTPVVSANVRPRAGTPLAPRRDQTSLVPYIVKAVAGVDVGIVGLTIKSKTEASSRPLPSTALLDEAEAARTAIQELRAKGVRHIVLVTHLGYANDLQLVAQLPEVDVIIGGDSHTLLGGDGLRAFGLATEGDYPTLIKNADGDPVCVVQAWEYGKAVGRLTVRFDRGGRVIACAGAVTIPTGANFSRRDPSGQWVPVDSATREALSARLAGDSPVRVVVEDGQAVSRIQEFRAMLAPGDKRLINVPTALCHVRVPGQAATPACGPAGSDTAQVVAEALLQASKRAQVAIQNAGGVRMAIDAGDLTPDTVLKVLSSGNTVVELEMTGSEIAAVLEDAVANHRDPAANGVRGSDGSHPYAAGLRWNLDLSKPRGQRFANLEVRDRQSGEWQVLALDRRYIVVTSDYLAEGKDGYLTMGVMAQDAARAVNTGLDYTQTFIDYIQKHGRLVKPNAADYSHKSVTDTTGKPLRDSAAVIQ